MNQKVIDALEKLSTSISEAAKGGLGGGAGLGGAGGGGGGGGGGGTGYGGGGRASGGGGPSRSINAPGSGVGWGGNTPEQAEADRAKGKMLGDAAYRRGVSGGLSFSAIGSSIAQSSLPSAAVGGVMSLFSTAMNFAQNNFNAKVGGYESGDPSDTESMRRARATYAGYREQAHKVLDNPIGQSADAMRSALHGLAQTSQMESDTLGPQERAVAKTRSQTRGLWAATGGGKDVEAFTQELMNFNLEREKNAQQQEKFFRIRDESVKASTPGVNSALQHN